MLSVVLALASVACGAALLSVVDSHGCRDQRGFEYFSTPESAGQAGYAAQVISRRCSAVGDFNTQVQVWKHIGEGVGRSERSDKVIVFRADISPTLVQLQWADRTTLRVEYQAVSEQQVDEKREQWGEVTIVYVRR